MAVEAIDFMVGHMLLVDKLRVPNLLQIVLSIMADSTSLWRDIAIATDQVAMAVGTIDTLLIGEIVVESNAPAEVERLVGDLVAAGAGAEPLIEILVLEMAQEAGRRGHRHVCTLDDLAVTARAAQLHAATEFSHMVLVIEREPLEFNSPG